MKKVNFKPKATLVLQFPGMVEIEAIVHEGTLFVPAIPDIMGNGGDDVVVKKVTKPVAEESEEDDDAPVVKKAPVKKVAAATEEEEDEDDAPVKSKKSSGKKYTEQQLQDMGEEDITTLEDMCIEMGINFKKLPGKNTNKKLRLLIIEKQDGNSTAPAEDEDDAPVVKKKKAVVEEEDEKPVKQASASLAKAEKIVKRIDTGDITEAKDAIDALVELGADKAAAKKFVNQFLEDGTAPVEKYLKKLPAIFETEEEEEEEEKPAKKAPVKAAKKRVEVEHDELEVGQRVVVLWPDGVEYPGEVATVGKKGITIDYDDDTSDSLDDDMVVYEG